jgi:uncharacterized membrane protein YfcA
VEANLLLAQGPSTLLLLVLVVFVGGCANGTSGLGFATVVAAALALVFDARTAVILLSGMTPIVQAMPAIRYRAQLREARRLLPLFLAMPVGVLTGSYLLVVLPGAAISLGLGVVIVLTLLVGLWRGKLHFPAAWERVGTPLVGVIAGVANSSVGVSGPLLGMYLLSLNLGLELFAFTVAAMFTSMGVLRLATLVTAGELSLTTVAISLALCVPALVGQRLGFWLQRRINQQHFNRLVFGILLIAGVELTWRGISGLGLLGHYR